MERLDLPKNYLSLWEGIDRRGANLNHRCIQTQESLALRLSPLWPSRSMATAPQLSLGRTPPHPLPIGPGKVIFYCFCFPESKPITHTSLAFPPCSLHSGNQTTEFLCLKHKSDPIICNPPRTFQVCPGPTAAFLIIFLMFLRTLILGQISLRNPL